MKNWFRAVTLAIRFFRSFRWSFYDNGLGNYVRLWFGGTTHLDISHLDGGDHKGHWVITLRNDQDGKIARHYTDHKESWL
jgi:hypothetical protein